MYMLLGFLWNASRNRLRNSISRCEFFLRKHCGAEKEHTRHCHWLWCCYVDLPLMGSKGRSDGEIEDEWAEHMCPCPRKP